MRRMIAVCFSAVLLATAAGVLSIWSIVTAPAPGVTAGSAAMMRVLDDEHALVADYITAKTEAQRLANAAADADLAKLKLAAAEEEQRARTAQLDRALEPVVDADRKGQATARLERRAPAAAPRATLAVASGPVGEPLPLVQLATAQVPVAAREESPVRARWRSLASDVRRLPGWFASATDKASDWIVEAVPRLPIPQLPMPQLPGRQFRAML